MEKINVCQKSTIQKIETCVKDKKQNLSFYRIQLIIRDNRNDARISLPIYEGGANPRITASSTTSAEEAIINY